MGKILKDLQRHLMTATSYMILFVVPGGIYFALSVMMNGKGAVPTEGIAAQLNQIGSAGLALFIPALGGYIAYSIAEKAGIGPGFIGAYLAREIGAGFIGGIIAGFIAGYVVEALKKIKLPTAYKAVGNIFLYPLLGTLASGGAIVFFLGKPIAAFMNWMTVSLNGMSGAAKTPLGLLLGAMIGVDMGGPINKVAATFAQTQVDTLPYLMGGVGAAIAVPPIGIGLATLLFKKKFSEDDRGSGTAAILMGCMGITEGAIPFATADVRLIPVYAIGSALSCMSGFLFGTLNHAPWGGLIVLPVCENRIGYVASILIVAVFVAVVTGLMKKDYVAEDDNQEVEDIELSFDDF